MSLFRSYLALLSPFYWFWILSHIFLRIYLALAQLRGRIAIINGLQPTQPPPIKLVELNKKFKKIPHHLLIILDESDVVTRANSQKKMDLQSLVNIVQWSVAANISNISFFDFSGKSLYFPFFNELLTRRFSEGILKSLEKEFKQIVEKESIKWHSQIGRTVNINQLNIFSAADGRLEIIEATRRAAASSIHQRVPLDTFLPPLLQSLPEPDLILQSGMLLFLEI